MTPSQLTPLYETHRSFGAKLIDFAGYTLPVWYSSVQAEHRAVRSHCGLFDISHMGIIRITGNQAETLLQKVTCSSTTKARRGIMTYSMVLSESGGILDDIMMGQVVENEWIVIVNAANKTRIMAWFCDHNTTNAQIELMTTHAMIAVQGPSSSDCVTQVLGKALTDMPRFAIQKVPYSNAPGYAMRSGYTGEDGFELIVPATEASALFTALIHQGAAPCGLAARDSLRIEAGLPLYGHELSETLTPLNTRYAWVVNWKGDFIGKSALVAQRDAGIDLVTVGLRCKGKQIPRLGATIAGGGHVTSGTLPPGNEDAVAMALVPSVSAILGTQLSLQIRNNNVDAIVVSVPFNK
ncbi:glycine cleavage system aminomethyltransferase GcvT [bacterium]|nr:glycine cleavage system aminomethyltransferase GcvT [bacterium]